MTILGIVIGVTTVITISSVINGLNNRVSDWVSSLGSNVIWVFHMPVIGVRPTTEQLTRKKLTLDDVLALRTLPHVVAADGGFQHVKPMFRVGDVAVKYNGKKVAGTILQGSTAEVTEMTGPDLFGRPLLYRREDQRAAHVCVLGHDTWEELFGNEPAVGKEVAIESGLYTVIGVLDKRKQPFGGGKNPNDNVVYFPMGTFHNLHPEDKDMWVSVKYDDPKNKALVQEEIREMLRIRRKVQGGGPRRLRDLRAGLADQAVGPATGGLVAFMIAVSSVGLMVGGVGVMNIMLVSVTERTREIGIRKAIGATRRTILTQFTTEAVTLCAVGGVVGVLLGAVLTWIVYLLAHRPAGHAFYAVGLSGFSVSCAIGLLFGIYPAWKAANLDPIEALRYE